MATKTKAAKKAVVRKTTKKGAVKKPAAKKTAETPKLLIDDRIDRQSLSGTVLKAKDWHRVRVGAAAGRRKLLKLNVGDKKASLGVDAEGNLSLFLDEPNR